MTITNKKVAEPNKIILLLWQVEQLLIAVAVKCSIKYLPLFKSHIIQIKKGVSFAILFFFSVVIIFAQDKDKGKGEVTIFSAQSYEREISTGLVLVDYWAVWCGPCRKMEPILKQIAAETNVKIGKLNVDDYKSFVRTKNVSTIPTMIIYKDGKEVQRLIGVYTKDELLKVLNSYK